MPTLTAERGSEPWRRRLHLPAYQIGDVVRYAGTAPQTVTYWHYRGGQLGPVLPGRVRRQPLSYLQLVEIAFVATFRALGVPLQRIRRARIYASQVLNSENPFAEYKWLTEGYHVMLDLRDVDSDPKIGRLIVGDSAGQIAWRDMVSERFAQFDYEDGLALVWWVRGRQMPVTIDPRVAFGAPTVKGVPTWALRGRWHAGESMPDIEEDFGLVEQDVRRALQFEDIEVAA